MREVIGRWSRILRRQLLKSIRSSGLFFDESRLSFQDSAFAAQAETFVALSQVFQASLSKFSFPFAGAGAQRTALFFDGIGGIRFVAPRICANCKQRRKGMPTSNDTNAAVETTADREIVGKRVFDAPRELVFDAFTDPEHIGQWWGPNGFTTTTFEMDVRPGRAWRDALSCG